MNDIETKQLPEFEIGDIYRSGDGETFTAGIHHNGAGCFGQPWLQRIEIYGKNEAHACELRDRVFCALTSHADMLKALKDSVANHCGDSRAFCSTCEPARKVINKAEGRGQ